MYSETIVFTLREGRVSSEVPSAPSWVTSIPVKPLFLIKSEELTFKKVKQVVSPNKSAPLSSLFKNSQKKLPSVRNFWKSILMYRA